MNNRILIVEDEASQRTFIVNKKGDLTVQTLVNGLPQEQRMPADGATDGAKLVGSLRRLAQISDRRRLTNGK